MLSVRPGVIAAAIAAVAALLGPANATSATSAAPPKEAAGRATINDDATAGRVISSRAACEREVSVTVLAGEAGQRGYDHLGDVETDRSGRWQAQTRRQGERFQVFAVVPSESERCNPAQSRKVSPPLRAAEPTRVRVSLRFPGDGAPRGRVSSPEAGCERGADVLIFFRSNRTDGWNYDGATRTDRQGRYDFGSAPGSRRLGIIDPQVTTVALASRGCDIGQSDAVDVPRL